jgi:membrane protein YqaA with SNARE-associated domain
VTDSLLTSLGLYGAVLVIGFIAGMFPLVSIEATLFAISWKLDSPGSLPALVVLAAVGHQIAKTICYFAGVGALERGPLKARVERLRTRIERWNRRPHLIFGLAATVGLPPLYVVAFIAEPMMKIRFVPFTVMCLIGRIGRYGVLAAVPWLA